jgi:prepilin-type N-terminal cleavage/methylation domain-containing protein
MRIAETKRSPEGMTLIEVLVGMAIFAIGCFTLTQVMLGAMTSEAATRRTVVATSLAHARMSEIAATERFGDIREENFPDEDYGAVAGGAAGFEPYRRTVTIADSTDARGRAIMKTVEVEVEWREGGKRRSVSLRSSIPAADSFDR